MSLFNSTYNKDYHMVIYPLARFGKKRKAFKVSPNQLHIYLGSTNANTVLLKASKMRTDKLRLLFRKHGTVYI
ncbi:hypothetical protein, partial [Mucilaginibacter sp. 5C4]|uniref:hypothetical protein n=1 Tax=Mucilaginibacter sp. 5C4 TaxID=3048589 RepID=UPI002B222964